MPMGFRQIDHFEKQNNCNINLTRYHQYNIGTTDIQKLFGTLSGLVAS